MLINDINHSPSLEVLSVLNVLSEQYENRIEWEELVYKTLLRIREEIYAGKYHPFSINSGFTHILCILDDLIIKIPDLSRFHNACFRVLKDNIRLYLDLPSDLSSNREYELITGLSGVARYLMDHTDDVESNYLLEKITDRLINRSVARDMQGGQITGYQYYPDEIEQKYMNSNIANGCVNYGVSHGMGGPLIVLSEMYERGYHNSLLLSTIHNLSTGCCKSGLFLCLFIFVSRKWIHIRHIIFFKLVLDMFFYLLFISSHCIHVRRYSGKMQRK